MTTSSKADLLARLDTLTTQELKRYLVQELTRKKLGLVWEADLIERDSALNANMVLPQVDASLSRFPDDCTSSGNLIIEGDNFDSLRLLKATHAGKIRVILIDPPYNTGNKDWVYNDDYVNKDDRWRHSKWLEFMYQRMTLARDLLTPDGVILICINDESRSRLELMMDEVMPGRRVGSFVWKVRSGGNDNKGALLSDNHEHVMVYANPSFSFNGESRDEEAFTNPDNDPRGPWSNDNLVKAHNAKQRPEAYYAIQNPETGVWYPCDPDSVWRFASTSRPSRKALQAAPIEVLLSEKRILWPAKDKTVTYNNLEELESAISKGKGPKQLKIYTQLEELAVLAETEPKVARLLTYIEPLEAWVGRKIGLGKPRYKRFRKDLKREVTPLSSWLHPSADGTWADDEDEESVTLTVGATGEGTSQYKAILANKDFPFPKPLSLIMGLLKQATKNDDTVLDFFAGSGTTGHAVLALNAEDGGNRKFILCSSTEATPSEPTKNICLNVCAERIRRVMDGYGKTEGLGGDFAYLTLAKVEEADMMFDATAEHAYNLLCLRETGHACLSGNSAAWIVSTSDNGATMVCPSGNQDAVAAIKAMKIDRVVVYTDRPDTMSQLLEDAGISAETHSLDSALRFGQLARSFTAAIKEDV